MYEMMRKNAISGNFQRRSSSYSAQRRIADYWENEAEAVVEGRGEKPPKINRSPSWGQVYLYKR